MLPPGVPAAAAELAMESMSIPHSPLHNTGGAESINLTAEDISIIVLALGDPEYANNLIVGSPVSAVSLPSSRHSPPPSLSQSGSQSSLYSTASDDSSGGGSTPSSKRGGGGSEKEAADQALNRTCRISLGLGRFGFSKIWRSASAPTLRSGGHPSSSASPSSASSRNSPLRRTSFPIGGANFGSPPLLRDLHAFLVKRDANEDSNLYTWTVAALVGTFVEQNNISSWSIVRKMISGITGAAAITALSTAIATGRYPRVSSFCARLSFWLSTPLFIASTGCNFGGQFGCVAGGATAAMVASILLAIWAYQGRSVVAAAATAVVEGVSGLWGCLWGNQRESDATETVHEFHDVL